MSEQGAARIEAISDSLTCPNCSYSLRGLPGDHITCPECGMAVDRAALVTMRWRGSWTRAPGYSRLLSPVALILIGGLLLFAYAPFEISSRGMPWLTLALAVVVIVCWALRLRSVRSAAPEERGAVLSLLAHVLLVGYVAGIGLFIFSLALLLSGASGFEVPVWLGTTAVAVAVLICCRRGERFIAGQCIRQHLAQQVAGAPSEQSER